MECPDVLVERDGGGDLTNLNPVCQAHSAHEHQQRHVAERAEDVSHVMKDDALNVLPNEGEPHFDIVEEKRIASEWKAGRL